MTPSPPVLDLNVATRPFRNNTVLWVGFLLGLLAIVVLSMWNVQRYRTAAAALDQLRADMSTYGERLRDLERRNTAAKAGIDRHDLDSMAVQTVKANDVISLKAFSWTTLFNRLEEILPYNVRMQRIRPMFRIGEGRTREAVDAEDRSVPIVVEGSAQDLRAFLDFEAALLSSPFFDGVEPERHEATGTDVDFSLRFQYYPNRVAANVDGTSADEAAEAGAAEPEGAGRSTDDDPGDAQEDPDAREVAGGSGRADARGRG